MGVAGTDVDLVRVVRRSIDARRGGWNGLLPPPGKTDFAGSLLQAVRPGGEVYFVHSYEAKPARPQDRLAEVLYGGRRVCAAARSGSVTGCQFHPEKSGEVGLSIIRQFLEDGEE